MNKFEIDDGVKKKMDNFEVKVEIDVFIHLENHGVEIQIFSNSMVKFKCNMKFLGKFSISFPGIFDANCLHLIFEFS